MRVGGASQRSRQASAVGWPFFDDANGPKYPNDVAIRYQVLSASQDVSGGHRDGFRGDAYPGDVFSLVNGSYLPEAGASRRALDLRLDSGVSKALMLAPAVEYNWTSRVGVLVGVRVIPAGRNTTAPITPAVAINVVH
jgi:hypothetical protein